DPGEARGPARACGGPPGSRAARGPGPARRARIRGARAKLRETPERGKAPRDAPDGDPQSMRRDRPAGDGRRVAVRGPKGRAGAGRDPRLEPAPRVREGPHEDRREDG